MNLHPRRVAARIAAAACLALPVVATPAARSAAELPSLGGLEFPITGSPECQRLFRKGMLEMHSFQYDQAHESFGAALKKDPRCAMAAWGDAMAYEHPIWHERDVQKSRAALGRITGEDRLTPRERAYIAAARALFSLDDRRAALEAWLDAAAKMHAKYPRDDEAALQHVLARIGVFDERNDQRELVKAGAIALEVLRRRPHHPGAAHYVIHAFDSNDHAILALPAARRYARIAPASAHALHMPSHTFTQLGMWSEVVPSNVRAFATSKALAKKLGQGAANWDWHAFSWLVAAHLELGQARRARELVEELKALIAREDSPYMRDGYADVVTNYLTQTGRWAEAESLLAPLLAPVPGESPDGKGPVACSEHAPGGSARQRPPFVLAARMAAHRTRAEASLRLGDAAGAEARAKDLKAVLEQLSAWPNPRRSPAILGYVAEIEARARRARADSPEARNEVILATERSVQLFERLPVSGPAFSFTPGERLAEALLSAGRAADALAQYEKVLRTRPNRALSLLGAARAARAAGDAAKAGEHYAALAALWKNADADLPDLAEVLANRGPGARAGAADRRGPR